MLDTFKDFIADKSAWDMFVTGRAGTGKTTKLKEAIDYCKDNEIDYRVCAFTHKACGIIAESLGTADNVQTLHSFIKKRPTVNQHASNIKHVQTNLVMGKAEEVPIIFVDEYSMIGEQDLMDLRALQDEDYDGNPSLKIVWLGDPYQLPPVGDVFTLRPYGDYQLTLTKIYRQAEDNPLLDTLNQIVSFIEGEQPKPLIESNSFIRNTDIVNHYAENQENSVILAYTNQRVQELNALIQGREELCTMDLLFSPTSKLYYNFYCHVYRPDEIKLPFNTEVLALNSKYKTLEHLHTMDYVNYCSVLDVEDGEDYTYAYVYGHKNYLDIHKELKQKAAESNKAIEQQFPRYKAASWAKNNPTHHLARARAKAWRDFLTFNECVICLDFAHAMTVHKSQGSTYKNVYLDTQDLAKAADLNYDMYLKLMYVGVSRASDKVYTN